MNKNAPVDLFEERIDMKKVLIVDDNKQIVEVLRQYSENSGYEVHVAYDGKQAIEEFYKRVYDVVLLDVMMPEIDGFTICKKIREHSMVPIIMITARGEDFDRIMGLDTGADDYIVKPFSPSEVMARIRAIFRRMEVKEGSKDQLLIVGDLKINLENFQVSIRDSKILLTKKEVEILWMLASNMNRVFSRDQILDSVWGYDYFGDIRTVDTHIKRLRAKLEKKDHSDWMISTVRGIGYKFEVGHA